jgi:hypothetical protein
MILYDSYTVHEAHHILQYYGLVTKLMTGRHSKNAL